MRRGDFEDLVRRHLDGELVPRGFALTPQPPADWDDAQPRAVYEAEPADFNRRHPALASDDPTCIDLWVELDPTTGRISGALNGPSIQEVTERLGLTTPPRPTLRTPTLLCNWPTYPRGSPNFLMPRSDVLAADQLIDDDDPEGRSPKVRGG